MKTDLLASRHIGINEQDTAVMLRKIGVDSLDELINKTIPANIRLKEPLALASPLTEYEFGKHIAGLASKNKLYTTYIGLGWYNTITPAVIQRNVFENPVWYTSYTPYQTEVSQGRLEALMNFQTAVCDLTAMPLANCSLLDEATAAAEAVTMMYALRSRTQQKAGANVVFVDENIFPQTLAVMTTRAIPQGIELRVGRYKEFEPSPEIFACILQYPNSSGNVENYADFTKKAHDADCKVAVAADILSHKGVDVDIVSPVEPDEIPAALARHVARRTAGRDVHVCVGPSRDELEVLIDKADVVVDAIFGTGFHGNLRAPFSIWIPTVNECADCVVSIDVPSGLNAETGVVDDDCIRAEHTVTMIAPKIGLYSADGPEYAGDLICGNLYDRLDEVIDDVDHAAEIVEPGDLVDYFAPLPTNIDKYSRGSVLIVAGSAQYPGAAIMAAKSAARAGAGYVAVAAPDACANLIRMALPSIPVFAIPSDSRGSFGAAARMTVCEIAKKYSCVLCGPGMTTSAGAMQVVSGLLELDVPLILDADALNCLAKIAIDGIDSNPEMYRREQPLVMTPHYRELSRLVAGDEVNDLGTAIAAAQKVVWAAGSDNLVVIAKGPTTAICGVERVLLPLSGPASLATAGSGDVLAGILAGTLATMRDEMDRWELLYSYAVALHSYAGFAAATEYGEKSVIATDLIDLIGPAMELAAKDALEDLGIMDEGSDD